MEVGRGVGDITGAAVGSGMLEAETGPATAVLVGGTGVEVSVGVLVDVGVGTGSCPQATLSASVSATDMMASVDFILKNFTKDYFP